MKLFLSSEGIPRPDLLKKLVGDLSSIPRVALINNAQDTYPIDLATDRADRLSATFRDIGFLPIPTDLREFVGKDEELAVHLRSCQLIWCAGGNAFWLRYVMNTSGFDELIGKLLAEGIVYGGWSAGAVVVGPSMKPIDLMDDSSVAPEIIWDGLGLVDYFVWPHWDTEKYLHLQAQATEQMKLLPYESITLRDGEVIVVEDGHTKIVS